MSDVLDECGAKGVKGVIILCYDFKKRVENSQALEIKIKEASAKYGFRVLGPDSLGFIKPGINLNASLFPTLPPKGNIALISRALLFSALVDWAQVKISVSVMSFRRYKIDIKFSDLIDFPGVDPNKAIVIYIESIKNAESL
jgi:acetyltransferase